MTKATKKLTEEQKAFVVQRLAAWDSPAEAVAALRDRFGVEISPQSAEHYDPNKRAGCALAKKWKDLFETTRAALKKDLEANVPIANRAYRLNKLMKAASAFEGRSNYIGMARMLEQAAKEVGGLYTNQRQLTGNGGGPIGHKDVTELTDYEINARMAVLLAKARNGNDRAPGQ